MNDWKSDLLRGFAADELIPLIEHYRSDAFFVYDQIKDLCEGTRGLVLVRKTGCEFFSQEIESVTFERYDHFKNEAVKFFYIIRTTDHLPLCREDTVWYKEVSVERADRLIALMKHGFKYSLHTGDRVRELLERLPIGMETKPMTDSELELLSEKVEYEMMQQLDPDMIAAERGRLYRRYLEAAANEAGLKYSD